MNNNNNNNNNNDNSTNRNLSNNSSSNYHIHSHSHDELRVHQPQRHHALQKMSSAEELLRMQSDSIAVDGQLLDGTDVEHVTDLRCNEPLSNSESQKTPVKIPRSSLSIRCTASCDSTGKYDVNMREAIKSVAACSRSRSPHSPRSISPTPTPHPRSRVCPHYPNSRPQLTTHSMSPAHCSAWSISCGVFVVVDG
jgi:hypothetical protein